MIAYTVTTYRTRYEVVAGFGGRDVRSDEATITVADRAALVRELNANGIAGRDQRTESGRVEFGGYVTEWAPVVKPEPATEEIPAGSIVMPSGLVVTPEMIAEEIARTKAAHSEPRTVTDAPGSYGHTMMRQLRGIFY